ncbi:MAG: hypothetical protein ACJ8AW_11760 [Rhodopila sp.]
MLLSCLQHRRVVAGGVRCSTLGEAGLLMLAAPGLFRLAFQGTALLA